MLIESLVTAGLVVYGNDHPGPGGFDLLVEDMAQLSRIDLRGAFRLRLHSEAGRESSSAEPLAVGQGVDVLKESAVVGKLQRHSFPFPLE